MTQGSTYVSQILYFPWCQGIQLISNSSVFELYHVIIYWNYCLGRLKACVATGISPTIKKFFQCEPILFDHSCFECHFDANWRQQLLKFCSLVLVNTKVITKYCLESIFIHWMDWHLHEFVVLLSLQWIVKEISYPT